ncbi:hypothetical protein BH23BAC1_BH23BAC1_45850 [soil metagenome]
MSEEHKKQLECQLWDIANTLKGRMDADEFKILIFVLYFATTIILCTTTFVPLEIDCSQVIQFELVFYIQVIVINFKINNGKI